MPATAPAAPEVASHILIIIAGVSAVVGVGLLLWGRAVGRVLLALVAAGAAAACSGLIARNLPYKNVWVIGMVAAVVAGLGAFLLVRFVWGALLGAILAAVAVVTLGFVRAEAIADRPVLPAGELGGTAGWLAAYGTYLGQWAGSLWQDNATLLVVAAAVPFAVAVTLGVLLPKVTLVVASSVLGAAGLVGAAGIVAGIARPEWIGGWIEYVYVPAAVAGLLAVVGLIVQARAEVRLAAERRAEAEQREQAADEAGGKKARGKSS